MLTAAVAPCLEMESGRCIALLAMAASAAATVPNFGPGFNASKADNMNGDYVFSKTPGAKDMDTLFPNRFADYPGGAEYFEVYAPEMTTLYSQVWWAPLAPAPIPEWFVKKYAGKAVAIIGWEIDQVRKGAGPNGEDISVPISATYNHHYNLNIIGAASRFKEVNLTGPDDPNARLLQQTSHGTLSYDQPHYIVEKLRDSDTGHSSSAFITSGNGGEYRKTAHRYPPGYAIVLDSPTAVQDTPMQIDTWNRDEMDISGPLPPKFVPGPLPAASQAPKQNPEYSGLLECPMTTRLEKKVDGSYVIMSEGGCSEPIMTFQECFHAAATTMAGSGLTFVNSSGSASDKPAGCSAASSMNLPYVVNVYFNTLKSTGTSCAGSMTEVLATAKSSVNVSVSVLLNQANDTATITLAGPANVWFGVGFNATAMKDEPWAITVEGTNTVSERKLADQGGGSTTSTLTPSISVKSNTVTGATRTVVVTRSLKGAGPDYFTFTASAADATLPYISAVGSSPAFAYHKNKAIGSLSFLPADTAGACVCPEAPKPFGQASGELVYHSVANQSADVGSGSTGFRAGKCAPYPSTTLINQRNPTCDIRHYTGGQWACHHMWSLLDADQEIPWTDQPLKFQHKYRFWVQPFTEGYHTPVEYGNSAGFYIGSPYEYDVPKCNSNVPGCTLVNGSWVHTITGSKIQGDAPLVSLNFHCHAPTCLSMSIWACPKGMSTEQCGNATSWAEAEARGYKLICNQEPAYGGAGNKALNGTKFDEPGYIAIPDCFWGSPEQGLEPPFSLEGVPIFMLKTANASIGHYGEMAGGQPFIPTGKRL